MLLDVRDIEGDQKAGVRTIPVSLGVNKTRNLLLLLNSTLVPWWHSRCFEAFSTIHFRFDSQRALWVLEHPTLYEGEG